jgi:hypothetical protein
MDDATRKKMEKALDLVKELFPDSPIMVLIATENSRQSTTIMSGSNILIESQEQMLLAALELFEKKPDGEFFQ